VTRVQSRDPRARRCVVAATLVVALAAGLLLVFRGQGLAEALETPIVANAVAVSAGLAIAALTLVRVSRRTGSE
jgi:lysylphosphatidylglycerol synthetase-like protein (DUF2156 family)